MFPETYERCPDCGHLVLLPCLACSLQARTTPTSGPTEGVVDLRLALRKKEYLRYRQVRKARETVGACGET